MTKLLQNPSEFCILVRREGDSKLSLVAAATKAADLKTIILSENGRGNETKLLHATLSDKGFGIIRGLVKQEL